MKSQDELKKEAGYRAADLVEDGMTVGLGTGSTVRYLLDALGERIKKDGVHFIGVPTSKRTADYGRELGMEIKSLDDVDQIDITIDGADEVDPDLNGIKGGGGAQTWEKLVATNSKTCAWIVDESKVVDGQPFETDEGNIIIDLHLDQIDDPYALADKLSNMTGVVEHGLFLDMTQTVVIGGQDGTKLMNK